MQAQAIFKLFFFFKKQFWVIGAYTEKLNRYIFFNVACAHGNFTGKWSFFVAEQDSKFNLFIKVTCHQNFHTNFITLHIIIWPSSLGL